jgi:hypothetical protein
VQDGRIHIEKINWPFLPELKGSSVEYKAGLDLAIAKGWLWLHESGTYVKVHSGRGGVVRVMGRPTEVALFFQGVKCCLRGFHLA